MRPPAPLPSFPRYTALPFPPQLPLYRHDWPKDLFASANKRRPVASVLLGRTKQKQSKTGQRRFEAAAGAEVLRRGRRTRDVDKRRRRPKGSVAAARVMCLGGLRPLPQPLSLLGGSRSLGGVGGVEAAAGSGPGRRGGGPPPPWSSAGPAAPAPTPRAAETWPRFPPSGPGPRAWRRGPAASRTPSGLSGALAPQKAEFSFSFEGGRLEAGFWPD